MPSSSGETQGRTRSAREPYPPCRRTTESLYDWEMSAYKPHSQTDSPRTQLQIDIVPPDLKDRKTWVQAIALAADRCSVEALTPGPWKH